MYLQMPVRTREEKERLKKIAHNVIDQLRKERLPIREVKEVLKYATELLELEQLREKE